MKAVIYTRVSPTHKDNTEKGLSKSIKKAIELCKKKAIGNDDEIIETYIDQYVSGKSQEYMKSFQKMIKDAKEEKFKRIYIRRIDRFGRNLDQMIKVESELHSIGISIYSTEENLDTSSEIGRLVMHILSHVAEWKRKEIIENTTRGRNEAKAKGIKFGPKFKDIDIITIVAQINGTDIPIRKIAKQQGVKSGTIYRRLKIEGKQIVRRGKKRYVENK